MFINDLRQRVFSIRTNVSMISSEDGLNNTKGK